MVSDEVLQKLTNLVEQELPNEAVGLVVACLEGTTRVLLLENRSESPTNSFAVRPFDVLDALETSGLSLDEVDWDDTILWHSHPSGLIGPSRPDMRGKVPGLRHLVITYHSSTGTITPTYY